MNRQRQERLVCSSISSADAQSEQRGHLVEVLPVVAHRDHHLLGLVTGDLCRTARIGEHGVQ